MENTIGKKFIEQTKYANLEDSPQRLGVPQPELQVEYDPAAATIALPDPAEAPLAVSDLRALISTRASLRDYSPDPLSLAELSYLLWGTQGVRELNAEKKLTKRLVPSAGSRHPFETWLLVNRVSGLQPGLYRYLALEHKLLALPAPADIAVRLAEACKKQPHVQNSAITFFWVAVPERVVWRYSQRGYRYLHLDAGHICQNLYLLAESIHCGVCAIAAYDDDMVNTELGLDGERLFTAYIATLGRRAEK